ncbi:NUDIX hydrolase [Pseudomonas sp. BN417]|uniref:NUDIX hydrolase n=1 Tax=Pseudomonas sp. BN417 TaxID=2567890 RepID=UPI002456A874|nr:NUDIX hydrolase [Pseudomonas sp. BN417]MDH4557809.1 NUDIX hydrolase [Pseudomonas sp. BN417]
MPTYHLHPRLDDQDKPIVIERPHTATPLDSWREPDATSIVVPDGEMPTSIRGIPVVSWDAVPRDKEAWARVTGQVKVDEPPFNVPAGLKKAAGVVVAEADGRIWVVAPTNAYGGYETTFPKGRVGSGMSLQATAIREAFEESGLQVQIEAFLVDTPRSMTYTRYYLARRIGGNPADMGWESQAVMLIPAKMLASELINANDKPVLAAIEKHLAAATQPATKKPYHYIQDKAPSRRSPVFQDQADLLAELIERFEHSVLAHFRTSDRAQIPMERFKEIWDLPDYRLLIVGSYACGFVCRDHKPDFDLTAVDNNPVAALGHCPFPEIRHFVHTLLRSERWADGYSSPILEAVNSGALALVAARLREDYSLHR